MFSVRLERKEILALAIGLVLIFGFYYEFSQLVNNVVWHDFVESVSLSDKHGSVGGFRFAMGESVVVTAKVRDSNSYLMNVFDDNGSVVFSTIGAVAGSTVKVEVPLSSPAFAAKRAYGVVFQSGLVNYPVPGINVYSSSVSGFGVVGSSAITSVSATFDDASHELMAVSSLLTSSLSPVVNKTVGFYLKPNSDLPFNDRGWIYLWSGDTDENGSVAFSIGINIGGGVHELQARFAGDDDFGACRNTSSFRTPFQTAYVRVMNVEKLKDRINVLLKVIDKYNFPLAGKLLNFEALNVQKTVPYLISNATGYTSLSLSVDSTLSFVDSRITVLADPYVSESLATVTFDLTEPKVLYNVSYGDGFSGNFDGTADSSLSSEISTVDSRTIATYLVLEDVDLTVSPNPARADLPVKIGATFSTLNEGYGTVKFHYYLNGSSEELANVTASCRVSRWYDPDMGWTFVYTYNGTLFWSPTYYGGASVRVITKDSYNNTIGDNTVTFTIQPAPANIVVYYPESFLSGSLNLVIAFSMSRTYEAPAGNGFFQSARLAPTLVWDNVNYILDRGINDTTIIHVYVNGSKVADVSPDSNGICGTLIPLSFSANHSSLNIRVVTNATSRYKEVAVEQNLTLTKVNVKNNMSAVNTEFRFNSTVGSLDRSNITYVSLNNTLEASASLLNLTVYNVTSSFVVSRMVGRTSTNGSALVSIPTGTDFVRVKYPCSLAQSMLAPLTDLNRNGNTTNADRSLLWSKDGSALGDTSYDYYYDLNLDYKINYTDMEIVRSELGNRTVYFDSPFNMSSIMLYFDTGQNLSLDSMGFGSVPSGATQLNMSVGGVIEFFDISLMQNDSTNNLGVASVNWRPPEIGVYLLNASLPSSFDAVVTINSDVTQVSAPLAIANYYYIAKTSVNLAVDVSGDFNTTTLEPVADAYVSEERPEENYGSATSMNVGPVSGLEYRSFIRFNTTSIPTDAYILSARLNLFFWVNSSTGAFPEFRLYPVSEQWNELGITWNSQPQFSELYPSSTFQMFSAGQNGSVFLNITQDVRTWQGNPGSNFGFVLKEDLVSNNYLAYLHSREASDFRPVLEVFYFLPPPTLIARAIDNATRHVISSLPIQFFEDGALLGSANTNSSGIAALAWSPTSNTAFNVTVSSAENTTYRPGWAYMFFDFRSSMNTTSPYGNQTDIATDLPWTCRFDLLSPSPFGVANQFVKVYINGTFTNGTTILDYREGTTILNGTFFFEWSIHDNGTFSIRAVFEGNTTYKPSEFYMTVTETTKPLAVLFSVSPSEFRPGTSLLLNATILDATTGNRLTGYNVTVEFFNVTSDGTVSSIGTAWNTTGEVIKYNVFYPTNGLAYAFMAKVLPVIQGGKIVQGIASNPVQLTVSTNTTTLLEVTRDNSTLKHTVTGRLLNGTTAVPGKYVHLNINDTESLPTLLTNGSGYFSREFDFQPENDQNTTYVITATFDGDTPVNATAWAYTLDGEQFAACTTIQYGLKPSGNMTTLAVDPKATQLMRLAKSPEELQKDAGSFGLATWGPDSWSIFPPFFKLHARASVGSLGVRNELWAGLFGCGVDSARGLGSLLQTAFNGLDDTMRDIAMSAAVAMLTSALTLLVLNAVAANLGFWSILGYLAAFFGYTLGIAAIIASIYYLVPDAGVSRALLYGIGFVLFGVILVAFWNDPQARTFPAVLKQQLTGEDPATSAAKSILAIFLTAIATVNLMALSFIFMNPWMWPFAASTFALGLWAIKLAGER